MKNTGWAILLIVGLIISISLVVAGIGVCFTGLAIIAKYILFMLSTGLGMIVGLVCIILLLGD